MSLIRNGFDPDGVRKHSLANFDLAFAEMQVVDVFVDGELHLKSSKEQFSYTAKNLTGGVGDHLVTVEGGGFARLSANAVQFSGTGAIYYAGRSMGFEAT